MDQNEKNRFELTKNGVKCTLCDLLIVQGPVTPSYIKRRLKHHDRTCLLLEVLKSENLLTDNFHVVRFRHSPSLENHQENIEKKFLEVSNPASAEVLFNRIIYDPPKYMKTIINSLTEPVEERILDIGLINKIEEFQKTAVRVREQFERGIYNRCLKLKNIDVSQYDWHLKDDAWIFCEPAQEKEYESVGKFLIEYYGDLVDSGLEMSLEEEIELFKDESVSNGLLVSYHLTQDQENYLKTDEKFRKSEFEPSDLFSLVGAIFAKASNPEENYLAYGRIEQLLPDEDVEGSLKAVIWFLEDKKGQTYTFDNSEMQDLIFNFDARENNLYPRRAAYILVPEEYICFSRKQISSNQPVVDLISDEQDQELQVSTEDIMEDIEENNSNFPSQHESSVNEVEQRNIQSSRQLELNVMESNDEGNLPNSRLEVNLSPDNELNEDEANQYRKNQLKLFVQLDEWYRSVDVSGRTVVRSIIEQQMKGYLDSLKRS